MRSVSWLFQAEFLRVLRQFRWDDVMSVAFRSINVYQAILGAISRPDRREDLLARVAAGLTNNPGLEPAELQKGVQDAVDSGLIAVEEAARLFPDVTIDEEKPREPNLQ